MAQLGKQAISIHILPDISGSKGNQTMKIAQLTGYNMSNSFLEKSYTKFHRCRNILKLSSRPIAFTSHKAFLKIKKMSGASFPALFSA